RRGTSRVPSAAGAGRAGAGRRELAFDLGGLHLQRGDLPFVRGHAVAIGGTDDAARVGAGRAGRLGGQLGVLGQERRERPLLLLQVGLGVLPLGVEELV